MLAPQQTIMRASAMLRCEGTAAKFYFSEMLYKQSIRGRE